MFQYEIRRENKENVISFISFDLNIVRRNNGREKLPIYIIYWLIGMKNVCMFLGLRPFSVMLNYVERKIN